MREPTHMGRSPAHAEKFACTHGKMATYKDSTWAIG